MKSVFPKRWSVLRVILAPALHSHQLAHPDLPGDCDSHLAPSPPLPQYTAVVSLDILPACIAYSASSYAPFSFSWLPSDPIATASVYRPSGVRLAPFSPIVESVLFPDPRSLVSATAAGRSHRRNGRQVQRMPQLSSTTVHSFDNFDNFDSRGYEFNLELCSVPYFVF
ncbi:hypothetical protein VUR80DRAFT_1072 [Thermomyces stellatus]